jgi:uncharacterized protein (TIGR02001 family)
MRKKLLGLVAAATLAAPAVSMAAEESPHSFTANVGLYSQYIFRGLTQTNEEPAIQGGFDYAYSGPVTFYLGTWGSNISWLRDGGSYNAGGSLELDIYGGLKGNFGASDFTWDVGYLYYWYPGDLTPVFLPGYNIKANTDELYAALGWKWFTVKYSYSLGDTFGVDDAKGTSYLDFSVSYPLGDTGITLGAHYGIQKFDGTDPRILLAGSLADNDELFSYDDWRISVAYDLGKASNVLSGAEIGAMYTDTSGAHPCGYGSLFDVGLAAGTPCTGIYPKNIADSQFTVWLKKTF